MCVCVGGGGGGGGGGLTRRGECVCGGGGGGGGGIVSVGSDRRRHRGFSAFDVSGVLAGQRQGGL